MRRSTPVAAQARIRAGRRTRPYARPRPPPSRARRDEARTTEFHQAITFALRGCRMKQPTPIQEVSMADKQTQTQIRQVGNVIVQVSEQDRALAFYLEKHGFEKRKDDPYCATQ